MNDWRGVAEKAFSRVTGCKSIQGYALRRLLENSGPIEAKDLWDAVLEDAWSNVTSSLTDPDALTQPLQVLIECSVPAKPQAPRRHAGCGFARSVLLLEQEFQETNPSSPTEETAARLADEAVTALTQAGLSLHELQEDGHPWTQCLTASSSYPLACVGCKWEAERARLRLDDVIGDSTPTTRHRL